MIEQDTNTFKGSKKALIDQMLLVLFLFFTLITIGATVSDNMQARDKYYNLKKVTDNSVLTLAKYYNRMEKDETVAESINYDMMTETTLGNEVKDVITYTWDFVSDPNTVTATINDYKQDTFWLKWVGLDTLDINVESRATIVDEDADDPTTDISYGFAPFAVNDRNFVIGQKINLDYFLTASWKYTDKQTFYPIYTECDCDCDFMLSNKFDFSDLGFDMENCDNTTSGCTTQGQSQYVDYSKDIVNIYNDEPVINFENGRTDSPLCLLGTYLGNVLSSETTQINHLIKGIEAVVGNNGANLPVDMDMITLNDGGIANGIVRVRVTGFSSNKKGSGEDYVTLNTEVIPAIDREIELEY